MSVNAEVVMKRKLERGKPLDEVKGSLDYQMEMIRAAFRKQFLRADALYARDDWPWIGRSGSGRAR